MFKINPIQFIMLFNILTGLILSRENAVMFLLNNSLSNILFSLLFIWNIVLFYLIYKSNIKNKENEKNKSN